MLLFLFDWFGWSLNKTNVCPYTFISSGDEIRHPLWRFIELLQSGALLSQLELLQLILFKLRFLGLSCNIPVGAQISIRPLNKLFAKLLPLYIRLV